MKIEECNIGQKVAVKRGHIFSLFGISEATIVDKYTEINVLMLTLGDSRIRWACCSGDIEPLIVEKYCYRGNEYESEDLVDEAICDYVGERCNNIDPSTTPEYLTEWENVEIIYKEEK